MKKLSQFRRVAQVGSVWTIEHASDDERNARPVSHPKKIVHVQSNAFCFEIPGVPYNGNPAQTGSWTYFDGKGDKAAFWEFPDDFTAVHYWRDPMTGERRADKTRTIYRFLSGYLRCDEIKDGQKFDGMGNTIEE